MLNSDNFPESFIPVQVHRNENTKVIWINQNKLGFEEGNLCKEKVFRETFSYYISAHDNEPSKSAREELAVYSDRYGGAGTNSNGGGARSAYIDNYQVKGIGRTVLAHEERDVWHSYGGLTAIEAVYEAAMSLVCSNILPCGAIKHVGVISTGEESAFYYDLTPTQGALLVRRSALRPAHLLRNAWYKNRDLLSDNARTKFSCQNFYNILGGEKTLQSTLHNFVLNCANQSALSFLIRFFHGSISPSNISIDGRWLDLANTGFTPSGKNYGGPFPVHEEWKKVAGIIDELVYSINKYTGSNIDSDYLIRGYFDLFDNYIAFHLPAPLGLPYSNRVQKNKSKADLIKVLFRTVEGTGKVETEWPDKVLYDDPFLRLIESLYFNFLKRNVAKDPSNVYIDDICKEEYYQDFENLIMESFEAIEKKEGVKSLGPYTLACAITSFSRFYLSSLYYKWNLEKEVRKAIERGDIRDCSSIIELCGYTSSLLYKKVISDPVLVYEDFKLKIFYCCRTGVSTLSIKSKGEETDKKYPRFSDMVDSIDSSGEYFDNVVGFNVGSYLSWLGDLIAKMEFACFFEERYDWF